MLEEENENTITSRHRKERKDLQSKIQSLKKTASKGDKKKRKEVLDEIAKIELELTKRHSEELNDCNNVKNIQFSNNIPLDNAIETVELDEALSKIHVSEENSSLETENNCHEMRVSKAQRRRDKKAQQEKIKEAEIEAEEILNKDGPRSLEIRSIRDLLKKRGLQLYSIPSDGDCLYNAICHQMQLLGLDLGPFVKCSGGNNFKEQIKYLRNETANYIEKNEDTLIFYMTSQGTGDLMTNEEFKTYCNQIRETSSWGGQIEIRAIANILKVRIEVLQASGPPTVQECDHIGDTIPTLTITYHRFMYSLGEHYNSTITFDENQELELEDYPDNDEVS